LVPKPNWDRGHYEHALMIAITMETAECVDTINRSHLDTADAALGDNKLTWQAYAEYNRLIFKKGGSLAKLRNLARIMQRFDRYAAQSAA
jgi:hypothetical protein